MTNRRRSRKKQKGILGAVLAILIALVLICALAIGIMSINSSRVARYPVLYTGEIFAAAEANGIPPAYIAAIIMAESSYDPAAVSSVGARGLMQIMPDTFIWLTTENGEHLNSATLYDPKTNIKYGTYYLSKLYLQFGSWDEVFAAYNAGPDKVEEWLSDERYSEDGKELSDIPFKETEKYVKKVNKADNIYKKLYFEE